MTPTTEADKVAELVRTLGDIHSRAAYMGSLPSNVVCPPAGQAASELTRLSAEVDRLRADADDRHSVFGPMLEELQAICAKHGALGGDKRTAFIAARLDEYLARAEAAEAQLAALQQKEG